MMMSDANIDDNDNGSRPQAAASAAAATKMPIVDLCRNDDEEEEEEEDVVVVPPPSVATAVGGVAQKAVITLLDDDKDDVSTVARLPRRKRQRRNGHHHHKTFMATDAHHRLDVKQPTSPISLLSPSKQHVEVVLVEPHTVVAAAAAAAAASSSSPDDVVEVGVKKASPLQNILEIFPDVNIAHVTELLRQMDNHVPQVLAVLAEKSYPKEEEEEDTNTTARKSFTSRQALVHRHHQENGGGVPKHDYLSASSFTPTKDYQQEALAQLQHDFRFLSKAGARTLLGAAQGHYAICHERIVHAILGGPPVMVNNINNTNKAVAQYRQWKCALAGVPLTPTQEGRLLVVVQQEQQQQHDHHKGRRRARITLVRPRRAPNKNDTSPLGLSDKILQDEVAFVQRRLNEWTREVEAHLARQRARRESQQRGTTMECSCCFSDVAFEEMIACREEGHLFCVDCLRRFAESQIFGAGNFGINRKTNKPALELLCMSPDGCCSSGFDVQSLKRALSEKVLAKYDELQFHASVNAAGIQDSMCSCPKCGYEAALPETQMIFQCPVAECMHESCRKCGQPSHIPLRCDEVEKDKHETRGRLKVEEAISAAKIRTCPVPRCGRKFVKTDGCNKITCACGAYICYVCRQVILKSVGYKHFCQKPHCKHERCKSCPLYSNAEEDDKRAMREAGVQAAEEVLREESRLETAGTEKDGKPKAGFEVRVDVDRLLN